MINIYCDGSFSRIKRKGAYSVMAFRQDSKEPVYSFSELVKDPASNKCELEGFIKALEICLKAKATDFVIYCDSQYCVNSYNKWVHGWASRNWRKSNKKPVKNLPLVQRVLELKNLLKVKKHVQVVWVKSHNGDHRNEMVDEEAKKLVYDE